MKIRKTTLIIYFIIILLTILVFTACSYNKSNNAIITDFSLKSDFLDEFEILKTTENYDSKTIIGKKEDFIIKTKKVGDISLIEAENRINDKMFVINSMYRDISSPYSGTLSNRIECEDEFKPKKIKNEPFDYYLIFATDRMTYGACSKDLIKYQAIMFFLFCEKSKNFFQIELYVPLNEDIVVFENELKDLSCTTIYGKQN